MLKTIIAVFIIVVLFIVAFMAIVQSAAKSIRLKGRTAQPKASDTAVVLGAYTKGFEPSKPLLARLRAALQLYREGYVRYIIVSGGKGEDESVAESSSMKRFLVMNGVSPEWIVEDHLSTDTWENLRNSQQVMDQFGFQTAIVVTSDYHLPRAIAVARQLKMDVSGYASWSTREEFPYARREVFAWFLYLKNGQLSLWRRNG